MSTFIASPAAYVLPATVYEYAPSDTKPCGLTAKVEDEVFTSYESTKGAKPETVSRLSPIAEIEPSVGDLVRVALHIST